MSTSAVAGIINSWNLRDSFLCLFVSVNGRSFRATFSFQFCIFQFFPSSKLFVRLSVSLSFTSLCFFLQDFFFFDFHFYVYGKWFQHLFCHFLFFIQYFGYLSSYAVFFPYLCFIFINFLAISSFWIFSFLLKSQTVSSVIV